MEASEKGAVPSTHHKDGQAHPHQHHGLDPLPPSRGGAHTLGKVVMGLIVLGAMMYLGILPRLQQHGRLQALAQTQNDTAVPVDVARPTHTTSDSEILLPGNIQAVEETIINARTSGYLKRRYVDIGSRVVAGQVLAEIEAPELDQQLMRAHAEASRSRAASEQAQADTVRMGANVAQSVSELARTRSNAEAARADLAHAKAKLLETEGAKSEAIAKLDQTRRKLSGQKAGLQRARTRLSLAEKTWNRWRELAKGGAVSGQELDETEANFESNKSDVDAAQSNVESAQADVDAAQHAVRSRDGDVEAARADVGAYTQKVNAADEGIKSASANVAAMKANVQAGNAGVRAASANIQANQANVSSFASLKEFERVVAPMSGIITARNVDVGALITAGSSTSLAADPTSTVPHTGLFGIARTDVLRVQVQVPQTLIAKIKPGQTADILVQEFPGRTFAGTVYRSAGALDATSRTLLTEIHVNNKDNVLMPGMYAQVRFRTPTLRSSIRVPANTLVIDSNGTRVATITADKKVHFVQVKIGRDYGKEVDILEGLAGSEELVTNPTDELVEGMAVRVATGAK